MVPPFFPNFASCKSKNDNFRAMLPTSRPDNSSLRPDEALLRRGVRPTALRVLIYRTMENAPCALSLTDLEDRLVTVDKSTIFRTLTLFLGHHLVHAVDDGTGQTKYSLCAADCHCGEEGDEEWDDLHTHFFCERCHHTYCLRGVPIPTVALPAGFRLHSATYVLKGLCPACAARARSSAVSEIPES